jgi:tetratricopeptide (TPR) repeat protein
MPRILAAVLSIAMMAGAATAQDEASLRARVQQSPTLENYVALAKFLEAAARYKDAETALTQARDAMPSDLRVYSALADFYRRTDEFDKAVAALRQRIDRQPRNAESHYLLAAAYADKAATDKLLSADEKRALAEKGLAAVDVALTIDPQLTSAQTTKRRLQSLQQGVDAPAPAAIRLPPEDQDFGTDVAFVTVEMASLRKTPDPQGSVVRTVAGGAALVMMSRDASSGWYNVVDADSSDEGWVRVDQVTVRLTKQPKASPFEATRAAQNAQPSVAVINETDLEITLTLSGVKYQIAPKGNLSITVAPGTHKYVASAPGVLPYVGTDSLEAGYKYSWTFFIKK